MDREDGFPPHIIGFMRRKREKEKQADGKTLRLGGRDFDAAGDNGDRASHG